MRDSVGGVYALSIVFAFIIIVSGVLAFTVNYNKAFKMKNRIITIIEKYENDINGHSIDIKKEIRESAKEISYSASPAFTRICASENYKIDNESGYCYQEIKSRENKFAGVDEYTTTYVNVKTFVSIDIPILNRLFPHLNFFSVTGSTKQITKLAN